MQRTLVIVLLIVLGLYVLFNARSWYLRAVLLTLEENVIFEHVCKNEFSIRIVETPRFDRGNKVSLGHFSRIKYINTLSIFSNQNDLIPYSRGERSEYLGNIKTLLSFTNDPLGSYIVLPSSVSAQNFAELGRCLKENKQKIDTHMEENRVTHSLEGGQAVLGYFRKIEGILLLKREQAPTFTCSNGNTLKVIESGLFSERDQVYVATIQPSGTLGLPYEGHKNFEKERRTYHEQFLKETDISDCVSDDESLKSWLDSLKTSD